ncbi:MAG: di-heme oxidoredictase family protein [Betaproteobacteria bacterium]
MVFESGVRRARLSLAGAGRFAVPAALLCVTLLASGNSDLLAPDALSAGSFTTAESGASAFSIPVAGLTKEQMEQFLKGREQFNEAWVVAPEPAGVWGLGPTFNEDRCAHCHVNNGRAKAPENAEEGVRGMLVRLSIPGQNKEGGPNPHPAYGDQLQNRGIPGRVPAEGHPIFTYRQREVSLNDGEIITLREPQVQCTDLPFGELGAGVMMSARIAPAMIGLGLLEAVPEETILAIAQRQEKPGVRGRPNYVWDYENGKTVLGRFGWKANQPNLRQQTATAFLSDIGATSQFFPEENCPSAQLQCLDLPSASKCGGQGGCTGNYRPEVVPSRLKNISFYLQTLAVPARRNPGDTEVKRGEGLFAQAQCNACHVPQVETGSNAAIAAATNQVIHPYTDLLLHDMGQGLADGRPDFLAGGRDWRTPPLWGIGLIPTVNGHSTLLHDGRARNVTEAILWHGGEAQTARDLFKAMSKPERAALVKFVESL